MKVIPMSAELVRVKRKVDVVVETDSQVNAMRKALATFHERFGEIEIEGVTTTSPIGVPDDETPRMRVIIDTTFTDCSVDRGVDSNE